MLFLVQSVKKSSYKSTGILCGILPFSFSFSKMKAATQRHSLTAV